MGGEQNQEEKSRQREKYISDILSKSRGAK